MRRWDGVARRGRRLWAASGAVAVCVGAATVAGGCGAGSADVPDGVPAPDVTATDVPATDRATPGAADTSGPYPVTDVVDGDTIKVRRDGRVLKVRLIGMDTPETRDPRKPVQCFGREASAEAHRLLDGRQVRLETDPSQDRYDKYGRLLAYVWLPGDPPVLFNELMIRLGYAHEYTYDLPYRYQQRFRAAQQAAEQHDVGLWNPATCAGDTTRSTSAGTSAR
ncbi:MAG: thermonuclease family protein [Frankiaceae bacterium]